SLAYWRRARERGARLEAEWQGKYEAYCRAHPELAAELERRLNGRLPDAWDADLPAFTAKDAQATRAASAKVLNAIAVKLPEVIGGSADLAGSTQVVFKDGGDVAAGNWHAKNIHFGVREHGMGAILNGLALHGAVRVAGRRRHGPVALVLTRQTVPVIDRSKYAPASGLRHGAYVLAEPPAGKPALLLIATGSEVELALGAHERLTAAGVAARLVSMPSMELFAAESPEYRDTVLLPSVRARLAVEA